MKQNKGVLAWTDLNPPSGSFLLVSIDANVSNVPTVGIKNLISVFTFESNESYRFQAGDPGGHQRCLLEEPGQPSPPPTLLGWSQVSGSLWERLAELHQHLRGSTSGTQHLSPPSGLERSHRFQLGPQQQRWLGSKVVAVTSWLGRVIHVSFYSGLISTFPPSLYETEPDWARFSGRYRCSSH